MPYSQENRLLSLNTPLGPDVLLLQELVGNEAVSRLFNFRLTLISEHPPIQFSTIMGQSVTISIAQADGTPRYFNGLVSRFAQTGADAQFTRYEMEVVPWLWMLTRNADCKIFQNMGVPDIIQQVFSDRGFTDFTLSLSAAYSTLEYCVQYRETDFNFVSRLMEQYGIYYFFQHEDGKHTMVLADSSTVPQPCPVQQSVGYDLTSGGLDAQDVVSAWNLEQEFVTGKFTVGDYYFETPSTNLLATEPTVVTDGTNTAYELYDYPGEYTTKGDGTTLAKIRMEEVETGHLTATGVSVCRSFTTGYTFELFDYPTSSMNQLYLLTAIQHGASMGNSYQGTDNVNGIYYSNHFTCIPASVLFRPARTTPKPIMQGPQTALVVGKSGEEIWVDQYGRIKVQFYWDRVGTKDDGSSCWIRVSQPWAGKGWGTITIPRIGQEVIVSFIEGDPDRPIVLGSVYNAEQTVPYTLPDNQTRHSIMSRSSKGGGAANFNEIRFEDKKDSEQVFINAEFDMDVNVKHDMREHVKRNRSLVVDGDQLEKVAGDLDGQVGGDRNEKVTGTMSLQLGKNLYEKSGQNWAHEAGEAVYIKAGTTVVIEAGAALTLKVGANFVQIDSSGVTILGTMVMINSGGAAGSGAASNPKDPADPDTADDGSKGTKLN